MTHEPPKRVLIVDDEPSVLQAAKMSLEFYGFEVVACSSGNRAVEAFQAGHFDAVVTDYAMPEMRGDQFVKHIRQINPHCRIVMMTAYSETLDVRELGELTCVLSKPFMPQMLRDAVLGSAEPGSSQT
jgi:CheY-like chemotaxis protein